MTAPLPKLKPGVSSDERALGFGSVPLDHRGRFRLPRRGRRRAIDEFLRWADPRLGAPMRLEPANQEALS